MIDWKLITQDVGHAVTLTDEDIREWLTSRTDVDADTDDAIRRLLSQLRPARRFMATSVPDDADTTDEIEPGTRLGVWEVGRPLGRGGMGYVYLATRADGLYDQSVALKVIQDQSPDRARRFASERRRLAAMEHPGISRIIDGGETPDGELYMAMEYVDGRPIDEHVRACRLDRRAVVGLVRDVSRAVAHAHGRLVLHRDIKAQNVLVDSLGQPRLIDFGISIGAEEDARGGPLTLATAAPEQLKGETVSAATDLFGLGVLLHQLLASKLPERQSDAGMAVSPDAAGGDRDLSAILNRALATDPARRYGSVDAFGDDLTAWLENRPVAAREGGTGYRVGKAIRRAPLATTLAAGFVIALAGGLGLSLKFAADARAETERARQALADAEWQYEFAFASQLGQSAYADLLLQAFGGEEGVAELTKTLMESWRTRHADWEANPDAAAALSFALSRNFYFRRDFVSALEIFEAWLQAGYGHQSLQVAGQEMYAMALFDSGRRAESLPELRKALENTEVGPKRSAIDKFNLAIRIAFLSREPGDIAEAERLFKLRVEETVDLQSDPLEQIETLSSRMQLARLKNDTDETISVLRELLAVFDAHPSTAAYGRGIARANLASLLLYAKREVAEAEEVAKLITTEDAAESGESAITARGHAILADAALLKGQAETALAEIARSVELNAQFAGGPSEGSISERLVRADALSLSGQEDEAMAVLEAVEADWAAAAAGPPSAEMIFTRALIELRAGRPEEDVAKTVKMGISSPEFPDPRIGFLYRRLVDAGLGDVLNGSRD